MFGSLIQLEVILNKFVNLIIFVQILISYLSIYSLKSTILSLAGVTQWIECWTAKQRVAGLIPSQSTCLGCGPGPQLGAWERQPIDVSLTHPLLGTWPATQACALTGNGTGDPLVHRPALNPLSDTNQSSFKF